MTKENIFIFFPTAVYFGGPTIHSDLTASHRAMLSQYIKKREEKIKKSQDPMKSRSIQQATSV